MGITRRVWTDDDGTGTTGTILDAAELVTIYDTLDGRWSELTTTSTGTQNNLSITSSSIEADNLRANNASALTLTGIAAPATPTKPGKPFTIFSVGAGSLQIDNESGSSTAANRIITGIGTSIILNAGAGRMRLRYDATTARWRVEHFVQGLPITYTPTVSAGAGSFTTVSASGSYTLTQERTCRFTATVTITTVGTATGATKLTLPFTAAAKIQTVAGQDASNAVGCAGLIQSSGTTVDIYRYDGTTASTTASGHSLVVSGEYEIA